MAAEPAVYVQGVEVDRRSARKDGREVVALRCVDTGMSGFVASGAVLPKKVLPYCSDAPTPPARYLVTGRLR